MIDLKPCPFCGSELILEHWPIGYLICCSKQNNNSVDECITFPYFDSKNDAIKHCNKRNNSESKKVTNG